LSEPLAETNLLNLERSSFEMIWENSVTFNIEKGFCFCPPQR
jgi:hypothetical protein